MGCRRWASGTRRMCDCSLSSIRRTSSGRSQKRSRTLLVGFCGGRRTRRRGDNGQGDCESVTMESEKPFFACYFAVLFFTYGIEYYYFWDIFILLCFGCSFRWFGVKGSLVKQINHEHEPGKTKISALHINLVLIAFSSSSTHASEDILMT